MGEAAERIGRGAADVRLAGASEAAITAITMAGMNVMGALSKHNDDPTKASRPFDKLRDGFLMAEGAGIVILESAEHAKSRNATILCEITGYGTSTPLNDKSETAAIKTVFGEQAYNIPVSSTKSMTGHLLGASGGIEAVICALVISNGILPPTINYEHPDPECDLDYVPNRPRKWAPDHVMSNSFGFGGHNATLVISRHHD